MKRPFFRILLGNIFVIAGLFHFFKSDFYLHAMPPYLPYPEILVFMSGVAAVLLGVFVIIPQTSRFAAWGIIVFLILVYPVNFHMASHPDLFPTIPARLLWMRLPLQFVMMAWAYQYAKKV
jgi:uncharacterized membrane protein